ncbi:MAG: succinylglutamate desuccinylase/aspartoacylase family protein, partial [Chloroflexi bacterium]|nr:succinylglutamate desuccinylase/aspartoacylase family protein [Chloroflexota bacterium]
MCIRDSYYYSGDPNRIFPAISDADDEERLSTNKPNSNLEQAYAEVYEAIVATEPACLIDLHTAFIGSIPFAFRDPVYYHRRRGQGLSRADAYALQERVDGMLKAFGFTIINEFVSDDYLSKNLHRSVSGSVLNRGGIPAATIELGSWMHVDAGVVDAALQGLRNVMRWAGLLDGPMEIIGGIPVLDLGHPVRRMTAPYAPDSSIVHHLVRPGELIQKDQPLVRLTNIFGQPLGPDEGLLRSPADGFVVWWVHGVVHYRGDPLMLLAVRDDSDLVLPLPNS